MPSTSLVNKNEAGKINSTEQLFIFIRQADKGFFLKVAAYLNNERIVK